MKKFIVLGLLLCGLTTAVAQTQKQKVSVSKVKVSGESRAENYAEIKFDTLRHNFGKFSKLDPIVRCSFSFVNTGTAPLVIHQALASCGCTVPTFTKAPVKPGERGEIKVTYNGRGRFPGHFQKTITVRSNAQTEIVRLTIEGIME